MVARLTLSLLIFLGFLLPTCVYSACLYVVSQWPGVDALGHLQAMGLIAMLAAAFFLSSAAVRLLQELYALRDRFRGALFHGENLFGGER